MQPTIQYIENELKGKYPASEIEGFKRVIFESVCGWDFTQQVLNRPTEISPSRFQKIREIVDRLKKDEPIQYITGSATFCGLKLTVNRSVLIPRPETEELVMWIEKDNLQTNPDILDIGTGSGCIALALKQMIERATVTGVDISLKAIETAMENAGLNGLDVNFQQADVLQWEHYDWDTYDVVVSNPPYVRETEKKLMHQNVVQYEPPGALYVPDEDPLIFYRRIAELAGKKLNDAGLFYLEINEELGPAMLDLMSDFGFRNIEIKKDLNSKPRMLRCNK